MSWGSLGGSVGLSWGPLGGLWGFLGVLLGRAEALLGGLGLPAPKTIKNQRFLMVFGGLRNAPGREGTGVFRG